MEHEVTHRTEVQNKYRVTHQADCEVALVQRGDITLWISEDAIGAWTPKREGRRGAQPNYSDLVACCVGAVGAVSWLGAVWEAWAAA